MAQNAKIVSWGYLVLYGLMLSVVLGFTIYFFVYRFISKRDLQGAYFGPSYLAGANVIVWIALTVVTIIFIKMLNKRFGEEEFNGPKRRLKFYLAIFSLSFCVRGSWDIAISVNPITWNDPKKFAPVLFTLYFLTEWLPIFILYLAHILAFKGLIQRQKERTQSLDTSNGKNSEPSFLVPEEMTK